VTADRVLPGLTATQAINAMRNGEISCERYVGALIGRVAETDLNALISFDAEKALMAARAKDARRASGAKVGPLHGLPIVVKDNIDVVGFATTCNTPALTDHRPTRHGPVITALIDAGAIVLAKANMHELAFAPGMSGQAGAALTYGRFGAVTHPHNPALSTGGSSSGSAAAVGAQIAAIGLGTDTGGSVRIPATFCGTIGYRPSSGRYSQEGVVLVSNTRDTIGLVTRSAADIALLDDVITGDRDRKLLSSRTPRLVIVRDYFFEGLTPETERIVSAALDGLAEAGCELVEASMPGLEPHVTAAREPVAMYECLRNLRRYLAVHSASPSACDVIERTKSDGLREFLTGLKARGPDLAQRYEEAIDRHIPAIRRIYDDLFRSCSADAIVGPSVLIPAPTRGQPVSISRHGMVLSQFLAEVHNSVPSTLAGTPTVSFPVGTTEAGAPVGLTLEGPHGSDAETIAIAQACADLVASPIGFVSPLSTRGTDVFK
jgi:indoleacetamide hydrolase